TTLFRSLSEYIALLRSRLCRRSLTVASRFVTSRSGKYNLGELVKTLLAGDPLSGLQRAARESFAAARRVAQRNGIGGRIKTNLVRAGMRAGPVAAGVDGARVTGLLHFLHQLEQCARRRVLLG